MEAEEEWELALARMRFLAVLVVMERRLIEREFQVWAGLSNDERREAALTPRVVVAAVLRVMRPWER